MGFICLKVNLWFSYLNSYVLPSIRKAAAAMNNLITAAYYMLLHSRHICKAVKDTGQVSALPATQPASRHIHCEELREFRCGQGALAVGKRVKRSQQNCTRSARHFREMKGHRRLRAAVVSFQLLVPWWSS